MLATVPSATLLGLEGRYIRVEVDVASGLPGFTIVGLADTALQEARERIRGALRNAGFAYPPRRITVNLAPADVRKAGASLDLAMAVGILLGSEQVRPGRGRVGMLGELSLGGEVQPVPGRAADGRGDGPSRRAPRRGRPVGRGRGRPWSTASRSCRSTPSPTSSSWSDRRGPARRRPPRRGSGSMTTGARRGADRADAAWRRRPAGSASPTSPTSAASPRGGEPSRSRSPAGTACS